MLEDILAGVGGALKGGLEGFTWGKEFQQKERAISSREEIARLRDEIRLMIAQANEGGRMARHETPSGNVVTQVEGANTRTAATNASREGIAEGRNAVTTRGQDITEQLGMRRDETTRRGQDFGFTLGGMRDETTRRGQDISSTTTRRGQDISERLGTSAETGRNTRATAANTLREQEIESRERIAKQRRQNPYSALFGGLPVTEIKEETGTGKPTAQPIEVKETTGGLPVAPRSPEAGADQQQQLVQQLRAAIQRYQSAATESAKKAAQTEIANLRARIQSKGK